MDKQLPPTVTSHNNAQRLGKTLLKNFLKISFEARYWFFLMLKTLSEDFFWLNQSDYNRFIDWKLTQPIFHP